MKKQKKYEVSLWQLFITFFKVGAFTFGGGYAMIAILEEELVDKKHWLTSADMLDLLVIAESTPGVVAVNTATSVGFRVHGFWGSIVATLGVVLPSFCIIFGLSFAMNAFQDNIWYKAAFRGIQACVTVLIVNALTKVAKNIKADVFNIILVIATFVLAAFTRYNVIFLIISGGCFGVAFCEISKAIQKKKQLPLKNAEGEKSWDQSSEISEAKPEQNELPNDNTEEGKL